MIGDEFKFFFLKQTATDSPFEIVQFRNIIRCVRKGRGEVPRVGRKGGGMIFFCYYYYSSQTELVFRIPKCQYPAINFQTLRLTLFPLFPPFSAFASPPHFLNPYFPFYFQPWIAFIQILKLFLPRAFFFFHQGDLWPFFW